MVDANEDKIITKKEFEHAGIFDWVDSEVRGDPSHPMAVGARDVAECKWYWKVWNVVDQHYKYSVCNARFLENLRISIQSDL